MTKSNTEFNSKTAHQRVRDLSARKEWRKALQNQIEFTPFDRFLHSRFLRLFPGILLALNGIAIISGSILGWIQPLWFSSIVLVLSNFMIGIAAVYLFQVSSKWNQNSRDKLREEAIKRVIESKN
jgi:hypothetical protein